jgi:hypothetical protein
VDHRCITGTAFDGFYSDIGEAAPHGFHSRCDSGEESGLQACYGKSLGDRTFVFAADNMLRYVLNRDGRIAHWSEFERGGHFPAMEAPDLLVTDVREFFRDLR